MLNVEPTNTRLFLYPCTYVCMHSRWLVSKGRLEEAQDILSQFGPAVVVTGHALLPVAWPTAPAGAAAETTPLDADAGRGKGASGAARSAAHCQKLSVGSALQDLCGGVLAARTSLMCVIWVGMCYGWYGLDLWIPSILSRRGVHMCQNPAASEECLYQTSLWIALANIPGLILVYLCVDRIGRKCLLCSSISSAAATAFALSLLRHAPGRAGDQNSQLTEMFLFSLFCIFNTVSIIAWNLVDVVSTELFPTLLRGTPVHVHNVLAQVLHRAYKQYCSYRRVCA